MTLGDRVAVLRKGVLQQVASPRELYEQLVNMFVAGFIGSPPMNFVPGQVAEGRLHLPFVTIDLPADLRTAIGERQLVMVGLRPERFEDASVLDPAKLAGGVGFRTTVDVIEWLGNEQYAYIPYDVPEGTDAALHELERELDSERMRSQLVVALDPASRIAANSEAELWFNPGHMHVFDPASGDNLTLQIRAAASANA
jgi:multiple sugar transport system ATP-binding protein